MPCDPFRVEFGWIPDQDPCDTFGVDSPATIGAKVKEVLG